MAAGKHGSNEVAFEIDVSDGGALSSGFIQYVTKIGDVVVKREAKDSTPFGVDEETYLRGVIRRHDPLTIEGFYDDTGSTGPDAILDIGRVTHAVTRSFTLTFASGKTISGECWITEYTRTLEVGEYHGYKATLQMTGAITEA